MCVAAQMAVPGEAACPSRCHGSGEPEGRQDMAGTSETIDRAGIGVDFTPVPLETQPVAGLHVALNQVRRGRRMAGHVQLLVTGQGCVF
jgi:hypothetical protein